MQTKPRALASLFAIAALLATACGPGPQPRVLGETVGAQPDAVTLWSNPMFADYEEYLKGQLAAFKKTYPKITVRYEIISAAQADERMKGAFAAGAPPDLLLGSLTARYLRSQVPVADFMTRSDLDDVLGAARKRTTYQGKTWFVPLYQNIDCMAGNRAMLEAAGVDWRAVQKRGWTWSEFVTAMLKVKAANAGVWPFVWSVRGNDAEVLRAFVANDGFRYPVTPDGSFTFTGPRAVETIEFLTDLYNKYGVSPKEVVGLDHQGQSDLFESGRAAVSARQGPYLLAAQKRYQQLLVEGKPLPRPGIVPIDVVLLPFPHNGGQPEATFGGGGGYQVFLQKGHRIEEQHVQDAVALARFLTDTDNDATFALKLNLLPSRRSALDSYRLDLNLSDPNMIFFLRYSALALAPHFLDGATELRAAKVQRDAILPGWEAAATGRKTAQQAVDAMTKAAKDILAQP